MSQFMHRACRLLGQPDTQSNAIIAYFISALVIIILMLFPVRKYYENNKNNYLDQISVSSWVKHNLENVSNKYTAKKITQNSEESLSEKSLFSLISETSEEGMLSRIEQRGYTVAVSIDRARLTDLLKWLGDISSQHGIHIQNSSISYIEGDTINAQIIFSQ